MKYRIVQLDNRFRVQFKGWFRWKWFVRVEGILYPIEIPIDFYSFKEAKEAAEKFIKKEKTKTDEWLPVYESEVKD